MTVSGGGYPVGSIRSLGDGYYAVLIIQDVCVKDDAVPSAQNTEVTAVVRVVLGEYHEDGSGLPPASHVSHEVVKLNRQDYGIPRSPSMYVMDVLGTRVFGEDLMHRLSGLTDADAREEATQTVTRQASSSIDRSTRITLRDVPSSTLRSSTYGPIVNQNAQIFGNIVDEFLEKVRKETSAKMIGLLATVALEDMAKLTDVTYNPLNVFTCYITAPLINRLNAVLKETRSVASKDAIIRSDSDYRSGDLPTLLWASVDLRILAKNALFSGGQHHFLGLLSRGSGKNKYQRFLGFAKENSGIDVGEECRYLEENCRWADVGIVSTIIRDPKQAFQVYGKQLSRVGMAKALEAVLRKEALVASWMRAHFSPNLDPSGVDLVGDASCST